MRIFHSFPTAYHLHQSDKRFENGGQNTVRKLKTSRKHSVVFLKLFKNRTEFEKPIKTKRMCIFCSFPTSYHLHQSDERFENGGKQTVPKRTNWRKLSLVFLKLFWNRKEFGKPVKTKKVRNFSTFSTVYRMHHSDKRFENCVDNTIRKTENLWVPSGS